MKLYSIMTFPWHVILWNYFIVVISVCIMPWVIHWFKHKSQLLFHVVSSTPTFLQLFSEFFDLLLELSQQSVLWILIDLGFVLDILSSVGIAESTNGLIVVVISWSYVGNLKFQINIKWYHLKLTSICTCMYISVLNLQSISITSTTTLKWMAV